MNPYIKNSLILLARRALLFSVAVVLLSVVPGCARHSHRRYASSSEDYADTRRERTNAYRETRAVRGGTKVKMRKDNGVYKVPIVVNGLPLEFVFDTGASDITMSAAEATVMVRQGTITEDDIRGSSNYRTADGSISEGTVIRLRSLQIGDIELHDVQASVIDNIQAPLLLGQTALARFGKISIDYDNLEISFN